MNFALIFAPLCASSLSKKLANSMALIYQSVTTWIGLCVLFIEHRFVQYFENCSENQTRFTHFTRPSFADEAIGNVLHGFSFLHFRAQRSEHVMLLPSVSHYKST